VRFDVYRTAAVLEQNQGSQRANAFLISFCKKALPRLELVAKKYECAGINSNVSAAVFGGHFDTRLMQYLASRMVNMVARYNRLPDMSRADIDLLAADIANFIRAELAALMTLDLVSSKRCTPGTCAPVLFLCNSTLPRRIGSE
jgi:hypothetical protein